MRKSIVYSVLLLIVYSLTATAQPPKKRTTRQAPPKVLTQAIEKKYPSLLWEITGNGMKQPSYLFGTMHVSDKLAFHLGDSFYNAIKSVEVVALETNPESWQDDYSKSSLWGKGRGMDMLTGGGDLGWVRDNLRINTFAIDGYEDPLKAVLAVEPSMINGMLYRTYGTRTDDFEEDTFLDMYIFQVGKKLGKRLSGVENFEESEKLVREAYRDMMLDRNRKKKSYDVEDRMTNPIKVEDAYRKGDLDMLDSLEALTVFSDAFQEKFLYKRNEIQANSIDSIIKKQPLFVGVGAAHLPGRRGVIEMLRRKGYKVRPVIMDERNSQQKETLEKTRVESRFITQTSDDGFYKVNIPGKKFYSFTEWQGMNVVQYADLVNGAYYMVTRMKTNSLALGHNTETVYRKLDSLLYENVPGKILKKTPITRNGYKGLDITNRTRRGDHQRYNIFVTPFEVLLFKISGNAEYILNGTEAGNFFNSIELKEYANEEWRNWQPATGGFSVEMPHTPSLLKDQFGTDRLDYSAWDKQDGNSYMVMKVNLQNISYMEADSFDLNLMDESYGYSSFISKQLSRKYTSLKGYPALESKYRHKDGSYSTVKYIIQGPLYYAIVVCYKNENANVRRFMESFTIKPFIYPEVKARVDTAMHFTVQSPIFPEEVKKEELAGMDEMYRMMYEEMAEAAGAKDYKYKFIGNDTIGEKILVVYHKLPAYAWWKDSATFWKENLGTWDDDSTYIVKLDKRYDLTKDIKCREQQYTDTGSSRLLLIKTFYSNGHLFTISALTDTLTTRSTFLQNFFATYTPSDTLKGTAVFTRKTGQYLKDLLSKDSATAKKANRALLQVKFDSLDAPLLQKAIDSLHWGMTDYMRVKRNLISQLHKSKDTSVTAYLRNLYTKVKDTVELQHAVLNSLSAQRTKISFITFKDLILEEPPIADDESGDDYIGAPVNPRRYMDYAVSGSVLEEIGGTWGTFYDTLSLTKVIFPDILQLMNVDDYEDDIMRLLHRMVDSNMLKASDYETYFSKIYLDARQTLKKQIAGENNTKMERAARKDKDKQSILLMGYDDDEDEKVSDEGNYGLDRYAVLLLPFREKHKGVQTFFEQLMKTEDRRLVYNTFILLLRNKQPVPDSLFMKYAKLDKYRSELYGDLHKLKMTEKFPAQYKNQQDITRSLLMENMDSYEKADTLVYLDKLPVTYKGRKGYVHFYKYKRMRDDVSWQVASVGIQPEKITEVDVENDDFIARGDHKLNKDKPVKEQLEKILKEIAISKHKGANDFYEDRNLNLYKPYLVEMVKRRRYRD